MDDSIDGADFPNLDPAGRSGVYAVMGVPGWVKIGRAKNIEQRMRELQTGCPVPVRLIAVLSRDQLFETVIHARFSHLRGCGEWFRLTDELRRAIEGDDPLFARNREEAARAARQLKRLRFIARSRDRGDAPVVLQPVVLQPMEPYRPKKPRRPKRRAPSAAPSLGDIREWLAQRRSAS